MSNGKATFLLAPGSFIKRVLLSAEFDIYGDGVTTISSTYMVAGCQGDVHMSRLTAAIWRLRLARA
jgi:hypothetical protein